MSRSGASGVVSLAFLALGACGGGAPPSPSFDPTMPPTREPLVALPSVAGTWQVSLWTSSQPPRKGSDEVMYRLLDRAGAAVDGLLLRVVPWMPAHGHGTTSTEVTGQGDGYYLVKPVYFYMSGRWELWTTIEGSVSDSVVPVVEIP